MIWKKGFRMKCRDRRKMQVSESCSLFGTSETIHHLNRYTLKISSCIIYCIYRWGFYLFSLHRTYNYVGLLWMQYFHLIFCCFFVIRCSRSYFKRKLIVSSHRQLYQRLSLFSVELLTLKKNFFLTRDPC